MNTLYTRLLIAGLTLTVIAGAFVSGYWVGKSRQEVKVVRAEGSALREWAKTVSEISTAVTALAVASANQRLQIRSDTRRTIELGDRYVEQTIPDRSPYDLPDYLFQLRLCQMDALYKAAGSDLPSDRVGASCPPPLPEEE